MIVHTEEQFSLYPTLSWLNGMRVSQDLAKVRNAVAQLLLADDAFIEEISKYLNQSEGKLMRPSLVLLAAGFGISFPPSLISAAAAIELIHQASLYHDDVIDESEKRRGLPSVNQRWGNKIAIFGGDLLLARALRCFAALGDETNRMVGETLARLWTGQMREIESAYNLDIDEENYFAIIELKTATLCELPCLLGAQLSQAPRDTTQALQLYGKNLGIAFQLIDDVLDMSADEDKIRKKAGIDIREGIYTLPVIYTLKNDTSESQVLRAMLAKKKLSNDQVIKVIGILRNNGALQYSIRMAYHFAEQARQQLASLPENDSKQSLLNLIDFLFKKVDEDY